jgi:hypothetical protein
MFSGRNGKGLKMSSQPTGSTEMKIDETDTWIGREGEPLYPERDATRERLKKREIDTSISFE